MEDVPLLFQFFLDKYNRKHRKNLTAPRQVVDQLTEREFPGNVRELENLVEQAVALAPGDSITIEDLMPPEGVPTPIGGIPRTLAAVVESAEREAITAALRAASGNRERAAETLAISATTLWRKMSRLNIKDDALA